MIGVVREFQGMCFERNQAPGRRDMAQFAWACVRRPQGCIDNRRWPLNNGMMSGEKPLPVLMPHWPQQRWSCHSCGNCCRTLVGHLFADECARIDAQGWETELDVAPYLKTVFGGELNKRADGACVFLDADNRCRMHSKFGEAAKPIACRIFPFAVRPVRQGWQASFRFDCPSAAASQGVPLSHHRPLLDELTARLAHDAPDDDDVADLQPGGPRATRDEMEALEQRLGLWWEAPALSPADRLIGAARVTAQLERAALEKVRGKRLVELVDLLFGAAMTELRTPPAPPTEKQRGMLRQLCFAHAEHVTLAERHGSLMGKLRRRCTQLAASRRFRRGEGTAPPLPDLGGGAAFAEIESVRAAHADAARMEDLLGRYVSARLLGRTVCGAGYYGWPVTSGLAALWLSVAAAGWLARFAAAGRGREEMVFDDFALALGAVDRAAGRLPSLGSSAERVRIKYLQWDDGVARLIGHYDPAPRNLDHLRR